MEGTPTKRINNQVIFLCDMQEKFRNAIWQFDKILLTTQKVLRAAKILQIPVIATTQNSAKLGGVVHELRHLIGDEEEAVIDKTRFSMLTQEVCERLLLLLSNKEEEKEKKPSVVIVGIESHICVTQTALDLSRAGYPVYVLADGVSSCNPEEVPLALSRLRAVQGVTVTSSESWLYETMGDASIAEFRDVARLVKDTGADTKAVLSGLFGASKI